ncbi:hypothetical protein KP509_24G079600 [Ceratopteris richardii]|uniref:Uncharacterized protein n=1 Tax=Ceratopteris richardii TaxID=49495 RepID=A0A8T2RY76_CERRI|nr:hypothetical protein KP509_24G079600 [Ceratopteris richardii]
MASERMGKILLPLFVVLLVIQVKADGGGGIDETIIREVTDPSEETSDGIGIPIRGTLQASPGNLFERFKALFNKTYPSAEEHEHRFLIFKKNLAKAMQAQRMDPTAIHGITNFSDLTDDEFSQNYLGLRRVFSSPQSDNYAPLLPTNDLPLEFDWRGLGAVTEVRNQGLCGSCWSFSAVGAMEGAHFLATGKLLSLSEQQLVDCDHECDPSYGADACDNGCFGGLMTTAFSYIHKVGGIQLEEDYPYKGFKGKCKFDTSKVAVRVANFSSVVVDEEQIAANLVKNGPLAVGINALFMQTYIGGVSCP